MISAFDVWLIMSADQLREWISVCAKLFGFLVAVMSLVMCIAFIMANADDDTSAAVREQLRGVLAWARKCALLSASLALVFLAARAVYPGTSTWLAMYTVPPIANSAVMQEDIPQYIRDLLKQLSSKEATDDNHSK